MTFKQAVVIFNRYNKRSGKVLEYLMKWDNKLTVYRNAKNLCIAVASASNFRSRYKLGFKKVVGRGAER